MSRKRKTKGRQPFLRFLFLLYAAGMIWLLFGQRWGKETYRAINTEPFETVKLYWWILKNSQSTALLTHAVVNLVGNVVMFIPLGFYVPYLGRKTKKFFPAMGLLLLLILAVEGIQYGTGLGSCDVDDVILNMAGAFMGYLFWFAKYR